MPKGPLLTWVIPGRPVNPLNGSWGHWSQHARLARKWRDASATALYAARDQSLVYAVVRLQPQAPKQVTLTVLGSGRFDDDALPGICKPTRDSLVDLGLIHSDGRKSGHVFRYAQERVHRDQWGIRVDVQSL